MINYQHFLRQTGTALHQTDETFEFLLASNLDIVSMKKSDTGSGFTEVHVLSGVNNYSKFGLQTSTALHQTDSTFEFLLASNRDIFAIKKSNTGTGFTEVHVLSAASNYSQFILQTGTALHETDATFEFLIATNRDIFAIKKSNTSSGSTEVHVLTAASNYTEFIQQTGTALHETDDTFEFLLASNRDIFVVKKRNTSSGFTEVHVLSATSNYSRFTFQIITTLHETQDTFQFLLAANRDLYAIKKSNTDSGSTEVHVLTFNPIPRLFKTRIALHFKSIEPNVGSFLSNQIAGLKEVYEPNGILVDVRTIEDISGIADRDALSDLSVGGCWSFVAGISSLTPEQSSLFENRNKVGANEIVIYVVRTITSDKGTTIGCATHPMDKPGAVVMVHSSNYLTAHEVGHVLGLSHLTDSSRLMHPNVGWTNLPPNLVLSEINTIIGSNLSNEG